MTQRVLVTGAGGAAGSYMVDYLCDNINGTGQAVYGLTRQFGSKAKLNLRQSLGKFQLIECDMQDSEKLSRIIGDVVPDLIFHFASNADVLYSFENPSDVIHNNNSSTLNLLEAVRSLQTFPKIVTASTSEVYGKVQLEDTPIKESQIMNPASPYGVSKCFQDLLQQVYFQSFGIPIIRTRMFTYINARRSNLFASSFAQQIVRIENNLQKVLKHGNLDSIRTVMDVKDAVRAYWIASQLCEPGEVYNIGGQDVLTVGEVLHKLISLSSASVLTVIDNELLRPTDVTLQIPDITKFVQATGWSSEISVDESLLNLLTETRSIPEYWKGQVT